MDEDAVRPEQDQLARVWALNEAKDIVNGCSYGQPTIDVVVKVAVLILDGTWSE